MYSQSQAFTECVLGSVLGESLEDDKTVLQGGQENVLM